MNFLKFSVLQKRNDWRALILIELAEREDRRRVGFLSPFLMY